MKGCSLRLSWPPSVNHYWERNRGGGMRIGARGLAYRLEVLVAVRKKGVEKMAGRIYVEIVAYPPDRRRRDIDNILKAVLDALEHAGVYDDDNQIHRLSVTRADVVKDGGMTVNLRAI